MTHILGLSAFYHDSAAALLTDGEIVAAAQEERFTRFKHDARFPSRAVAFCLNEAGVSARDLDAVAFYETPLVKFDRLLETFLGEAPRGFELFQEAMPVWAQVKLQLPARIRTELPGFSGELHFTDHHESHAASAFFPSPFESAAILTLDAVGRMEYQHVRARSRKRARSHPRAAFSTFAGHAVFGVHVLRRLQGQFRRIQVDGSGALRQAAVRGSHPGEARQDRTRTGRFGST